MGQLNFSSEKLSDFKSSALGAGGGSRTHTSFRTQDFKSCASTIPPHQHIFYVFYFIKTLFESQ